MLSNEITSDVVTQISRDFLITENVIAIGSFEKEVINIVVNLEEEIIDIGSNIRILVLQNGFSSSIPIEPFDQSNPQLCNHYSAFPMLINCDN